MVADGKNDLVVGPQPGLFHAHGAKYVPGGIRFRSEPGDDAHDLAEDLPPGACLVRCPAARNPVSLEGDTAREGEYVVFCC
jgi:hypothetical protein